MKQTFIRREPAVLFAVGCRILGIAGLLCMAGAHAHSQPTLDEGLRQQLQQLSDAMTRTQAQLEDSQRQLQEIRGQLAALQKQLAESVPASAASSSAQLSAAVNEIREQQSMQEAQIATHEQAKVESESKFPVKLNGLILLNGFVNTKQVDAPATPSMVLPGKGTTGATFQQTILGLDARGPHLFNARTHADVRIDFAGDLSAGYPAAGSDSGGFIRLRTAHANLQWEHTDAFFSLDHTIAAPNTPTSLTAVAVPALAWSGNLWTWNPQAGMTGDIPLTPSQRLRMQGALIAVADAPPIYNLSAAQPATSLVAPTTAELSRWPGAEGRIALLGSSEKGGLQLGIGGVFAPHRIFGFNFDSWAGTLDYRIPFTSHTELSGSFYHGEALGGLGGGAYKDYLVRPDPDNPGHFYYRTLDSSGGWAQLKQRVHEHLEFNAAFGTDQVPAEQLRPYAGPASAIYLNLARNRTYVGNVIYSPSAYLLFSLEYRHLQSSPVNGATNSGDVIGIATGYRF
jgi:hypothetical protein